MNPARTPAGSLARRGRPDDARSAAISGGSLQPRDERAKRAAGGSRPRSGPAALPGRELAAAPSSTSLDTYRPSCTKRDSARTSCTHPADPGDDRGAPKARRAIYADSVGAHDFRAAVAGALGKHWPERARALRMCGRAAVKLACGDCSAPHLVPYRCGARTCPTCSRAGAAAIVERVAGRVARFNVDVGAGGYGGPVAPWDGPGLARRRGWKHLVLTTPAPLNIDERFNSGYLRETAQHVRRAFAIFWRSTPWGRQVNDRNASGRRVKRSRRDTAYALGLEMSPRGMVHLHVAVFGEFVPQSELAGAWSKAYGAGRRLVVHVTALRGDSVETIRKSLREVLKYATKGEKEGRRIARAAAVETALRGRRRVEIGGALRRYGPVDEDLTQEDLHAAGVAGCEICGARGRWSWEEIRAPWLVDSNGGFGLMTVDDGGPAKANMRELFGAGPPVDDFDDGPTAAWREHRDAHAAALAAGERCSICTADPTAQLERSALATL